MASYLDVQQWQIEQIKQSLRQADAGELDGARRGQEESAQVAARVRLCWTPIAMGHLRAAYEYVARENAAAAETLVEQIFAVVERLEQYPRMGRVEGTRELVIAGTAFVVVYRVEAERVEVLAVLHAARKWPEEF